MSEGYTARGEADAFPQIVDAHPLDHLLANGLDDAPALSLASGLLTYGALRERVALLSGWLKNQVPEPGARVASWAGKGELTCLLPLAAAGAGLVRVPTQRGRYRPFRRHHPA